MRITQFVIYFLFFISLSVLAILSFVFEERYTAYARYTADVEKTYKTITAISRLESLLKDTETGHRGYLLTQDSSFLQPLLNADEEIKKVMLDLKTLTTGNESQQKRVIQLNLLIVANRDAIRHTLLMFLYNKEVYRKNLLISKDKMDECRQVTKAMIAEEEHLLISRNQNKYLYESTAANYLIWLFTFSAFTFMISCFVIIKEFRERKKYQSELELKLQQLHQSNAELEQITYVASHDLQEPLRKINSFTDRLEMKHAQFLNEEGKSVINRISYSSNRMRELVEDLANYIGLVQIHEKKQAVDLKRVIDSICEEDVERIKTNKAQLFYDHLPGIQGYFSQLRLLFKALVDNSLKFAQDNTPSHIHIYAHAATADELKALSISPDTRYIKVTLRDNGIGFDNEFADRMFGIFQRLHPQHSPYDGKGIGLAIVKRVMTNHNGFVFAKGIPMTGAEFVLFFPA
jgi:CHASE3 domain sensor protein/nitrogen-specific signal transduction histidine kinase